MQPINTYTLLIAVILDTLALIFVVNIIDIIDFIDNIITNPRNNSIDFINNIIEFFKLKYNKFENIAFNSYFSYLAFIKSNIDLFSILGVFGAIITYLNTLVDRSIFEGSLKYPDNNTILYIINGSLTKQISLTEDKNYLYLYLINAGISTSYIIFIFVSITVIWRALYYYDETNEEQKLTDILNIKSVEKFDLNLYWNIYKRFTLIFFFGLLSVILFMYVYSIYSTYIKFIIEFLFLSLAIVSLIILRKNFKIKRFGLLILMAIYISLLPILIIVNLYIPMGKEFADTYVSIFNLIYVLLPVSSLTIAVYAIKNMLKNVKKGQ